MVTMATVALCYNKFSKNDNNNKRSINNKSINFIWETELSLLHVKNLIGCHPVDITYQCSSGLLVFWTIQKRNALNFQWQHHNYKMSQIQSHHEKDRNLKLS